MGIGLGEISTDEIDVGNDSSLQLTGAMTALAWVHFATAAQNIEIISKQTSGDRGFTLQADDDPPDDTWGIFHIATAFDSTLNSGWTASHLTTGVWYLLGGMFEPSTRISVWLQGVKSGENTTSIPATQYNSGNNVSLGNRPGGGAPLDCCIDYPMIYNRALTAAEMLSIYNGKLILDGLVSYWPMAEKSPGSVVSGANSVIDIMNAGNHGSPVGTNTYVESVTRPPR